MISGQLLQGRAQPAPNAIAHHGQGNVAKENQQFYLVRLAGEFPESLLAVGTEYSQGSLSSPDTLDAEPSCDARPYTVSFFLPLRRRAASTRRPVGDAILLRNP